jgi:phenylalanyl-tRNA synthetase beta chain
MKGDLQALFATLNIHDVRLVTASHPALHPGKTARVFINQQEAGWLGVLHPRLLDALDLNTEVMVFELSLNLLSNATPTAYQPISKYPQIRRDLSMLVNQEVSTEEIEQIVRQVVVNDWLKTFEVFDVYTGDHIPENKKSLAIALTLQDDNRTLVDAEINAIISAIIKKLDEEYAIILRD